MLRRILFPFKMGLGGRLGSGQQLMSWIGIDDVIGALYHVLMTESIHGPVNMAAPMSISQAEFSQALARKLGRPMFAPIPAWVLRALFGEMADGLLLSSASVVPERLMETGYLFRHPNLGEALNNVI